MNTRIAVVSGVALMVAIVLLSGCGNGESVATYPTATPAMTETPGASPTGTPPAGGVPSSSFLPEVPRIYVDEVKARLDAGSNIVIIDARSASSYDWSHIAGAISLPLGDIAGRYSYLDKYDEIITYCS
ncbi:MAG: rhodanese-like domain-containing protein [Dehalococcoidia bacterium]